LKAFVAQDPNHFMDNIEAIALHVDASICFGLGLWGSLFFNVKFVDGKWETKNLTLVSSNKLIFY
jgi:hypothetical protein